MCGFGPDLIGIHSLSFAVRSGVAACSNTLSQGLQKNQAAREYDFALVLALSPICDKEFVAPSIARSIAEAFKMICCLDRKGKLDDSPQDNKQKAATALLRDALHRQDFAGPISLPVPKVLGPISRFQVVEIVPHMKLASRASRPGRTDGKNLSNKTHACSPASELPPTEAQSQISASPQHSYHNT